MSTFPRTYKIAAVSCASIAVEKYVAPALEMGAKLAHPPYAHVA